MSIDTSNQQALLLDAQNPWPGLLSFSEANQAFFFGRDQEIAELARRVKQEPLTVFFGKSGLGKSSILQAGLSPRLRESRFVPIYIRLDYAEGDPSLVVQIFAQINEILDREHIDAPRPDASQTLWEYFHHNDCDWWAESNELVRPVLLFDQFEELLTLGQTTSSGRKRLLTLLTNLEDLVDNKIPAELERRLAAEKGLARDFDLNRSTCHVVLALREDFLADLESLHERLRPIMRNRYRLLPMSQQQALDVVLKPGRLLVEESVARQIVRFVSAADEEESHEDFQPAFSEANHVEPALLSVVLQELNKRRLQGRQPCITAQLFDKSHAADILQDFYQRAIEDFHPQVRDFVVDCLLTSSGARNRFAEEDALTKPGITPEVLAGLIDRRIVQRQTSGHTKWLELTHDTLAEVVAKDRAESQHRRALASVKASEEAAHRSLRRTQRLVAVFAGLLLAVLVGLGGTIHYWRQAHRSAVAAQSERDRATTEERQVQSELDRVRQLAQQRSNIEKTLQDNLQKKTLQDQQFRVAVQRLAEDLQKTILEDEQRRGKDRGDTPVDDPAQFRTRGRRAQALAQLLGALSDKEGARQANHDCVLNFTRAERGGDYSEVTVSTLRRCSEALSENQDGK